MPVTVSKIPSGLRRLQRLGPKSKVGRIRKVARAKFKSTNFLKHIARKRPVFSRNRVKRS